MSADHPLTVAARAWTTNEDTLSQAQRIGETLDAIVASALALNAPTDESRTMLHTAVVELDRLPQWFVTNMPGAAWQRVYEAQRRALNQRAVELFGARDGQLIAPRLEHEPTMTLGRSIWLR